MKESAKFPPNIMIYRILNYEAVGLECHCDESKRVKCLGLGHPYRAPSPSRAGHVPVARCMTTVNPMLMSPQMYTPTTRFTLSGRQNDGDFDIALIFR